MLKSGVIFRQFSIPSPIASAICGRRYVQTDFHGPEWDLKKHRMVETYEADRDWMGRFRTRGGSRTERWKYYDQVVWRPDYRYPDGEAKPGETFYVAENIKHSQKKLFYACYFAQGRSVDDADKQLQFIPRKAAIILRKVLKSAVDKAVEEHDIEFRSNLWVGE